MGIARNLKIYSGKYSSFAINSSFIKNHSFGEI
nr:MAG TPA: SERUM RESPONSE FACTOR, ETS-DOMAIN PROTEIN REGULATION, TRANSCRIPTION COMPLEX, SERUM.15A [Caudoviricetes sp.]